MKTILFNSGMVVDCQKYGFGADPWAWGKEASKNA